MFDTSTGKVGTFKGYNVQVVDINPGDTILLHVSEDLGFDECQQILKEMKATFPNNSIVCVNEYILKEMTILRHTNKKTDTINEISINTPLEQLYPDLFSKGNGIW